MHAVIRDGEERLLTGFSQEEREQFQQYLLRALQNVSPEFEPEKEEPSK